MSFANYVPKGLKWIECECGIGGKNYPICYIPKHNPMQDALEKRKKTTYVKLTLPNTGDELKVVIWVSRTPEQFLLHVYTAIHMCKQMGLDANFSNTENAVMTAKLDAKLVKMEYAHVCSSEKKKNKSNN